MTDDEEAIRTLIATWTAASAAGDAATVLSLIDDHALFMVPGQPPFSKQTFAAAMNGMRGVTMSIANEVIEVEVVGDFAWARSQIEATITPPAGAPVHKAGYALSIFHRQADGRWLLARDANLMTTVTSA